MADNINRDRALAKIKKLLQLAKDSRGDATTAETAMRQAQAMMAKFNIDEAEAILTDLSKGVEAIVMKWRKAGVNAHATNTIYKFPEWAGIVSYGVGKLYDCRTAVSKVVEGGVNHGQVVVFFGYNADVEVATWTFDYLMDCVKRACSNFENAIKASKREALEEFGVGTISDFVEISMMTPKARKAAFRHTMAIVLQNRMLELRRQRDAAMQQPAAASTSMALVVVNAKEQALTDKLGPEEVGTVKKQRVGNAAEYAGAAAGYKARIDPAPLQHSAGAQRQALQGSGT